VKTSFEAPQIGSLIENLHEVVMGWEKFSNSPTRPRPCESITLIYFHHPPIIIKLISFSLLTVRKTKGCSVLIHDTKIHRAEICFCHNLKTIHPFANLFQREMHKDDGNMLKQFQRIRVCIFWEITHNHFYIFALSVHLFKKLFHGEMHIDDGNMPKKFEKIIVHGFQ